MRPVLALFPQPYHHIAIPTMLLEDINNILYILAILLYPIIFYALLNILREYFLVIPLSTITVTALFTSGFTVACTLADGIIPPPFIPRTPWVKVVQPLVYGLVGASWYMTTVWERQNPGVMDEALGFGKMRRREEENWRRSEMRFDARENAGGRGA